MHASYSEVQLDHGNLEGKRVRRYRRIQPAKAGLGGGMIFPFGRVLGSAPLYAGETPIVREQSATSRGASVINSVGDNSSHDRCQRNRPAKSLKVWSASHDSVAQLWT